MAYHTAVAVSEREKKRERNKERNKEALTQAPWFMWPTITINEC